MVKLPLSPTQRLGRSHESTQEVQTPHKCVWNNRHPCLRAVFLVSCLMHTIMTTARGRVSCEIQGIILDTLICSFPNRRFNKFSPWVYPLKENQNETKQQQQQKETAERVATYLQLYKWSPNNAVSDVLLSATQSTLGHCQSLFQRPVQEGRESPLPQRRPTACYATV